MIREHSEAVLRIHRAVIDEVQCCKRWNRDKSYLIVETKVGKKSGGDYDTLRKTYQEAYDAYTFGDMANASKLFEAAANAVADAPSSKFDGESLYNAGFTALGAEDLARAKSLFEKCIANKVKDKAVEKGKEVAKDAAKKGVEEGLKALKK